MTSRTPVILEGAVRGPVALLQLVPEGGHEPLEGVPHDEHHSGALLPRHLQHPGVGQGRRHLPGRVVGLVGVARLGGLHRLPAPARQVQPVVHPVGRGRLVDRAPDQLDLLQ